MAHRCNDSDTGDDSFGCDRANSSSRQVDVQSQGNHANTTRVTRSGGDGKGAAAAHDSLRREAIMFLTVLAIADPSAWLRGCMRYAKSRAPPPLPLTPEVVSSRIFCYTINPQATPAQYGWEALKCCVSYPAVHERDDVATPLRHRCDLVAPSVYAARAVRKWQAKLRELASVKTVASPANTKVANQVRILRTLTKTVLTIKPLKKAAAKNQTPFHVHAQVFNALAKLLETGVRVVSLTLPQYETSGRGGTNENDKTLRTAWTALVQSALGVLRWNQRPSVRVDHMVLPELYMYPAFFVPFCSAMVTTRVLKSVRLELGRVFQDVREGQQQTWAWLGYALFSKDAKNTVETLDLGGFHLTSDVIQELRIQSTAADPLGTLWHSMTGMSLPCLSQWVSRHMGAFRISKSEVGNQSDGKEIMPCVGTVIALEPKQLKVHMLVQGFGFIEVNQADLKIVTPVGPLNSVPACSITTLLVDCQPPLVASLEGRPHTSVKTTQFKQLMAQFLEIIGAPLTRLVVEAGNLVTRKPFPLTHVDFAHDCKAFV